MAAFKRERQASRLEQRLGSNTAMKTGDHLSALSRATSSCRPADIRPRTGTGDLRASHAVAVSRQTQR